MNNSLSEIESSINPRFNVGPILTNVENLLWSLPRELVEQEMRLDLESDGDNYFIGMSCEESAFLSGLIRDKNPQKIVEVGVNHGGTTLVILKALELLNSQAKLYSTDIDQELPGKDLLGSLGDCSGRFVLKYGRDISAYMNEIGDGIDFCIIDTAHYLPGELLNFLCMLPYLKVGATVVVHDQVLFYDRMTAFVKRVGNESTISSRVLVDTVVADKLIPNFVNDGSLCAPNIAAFTITEDTLKYVRDLFSALMLPWRLLPGKDQLSDVLCLLNANYPPHYVEYFTETIKRQLNYHLEGEDSSCLYWSLVMLELQSNYGMDKVAFYGAGSYCKNLIDSVLPKDLLPKLVFDSQPTSSVIGSLPVRHISELSGVEDRISVVVIVSNAHHQEIALQLANLENKGIEIINPFNFPCFSTYDCWFKVEAV